MIDSQLLTETVAAAIEGTDMFIVSVDVAAGNSITVEIDSASGVDIDTCAAITRRIEQTFDRDVEDYELEVGSAGLTSPFKVKGQYLKNIGNEVEVLTCDGRKLHGTLVAVDDACTEFVIEMLQKVKEPGMKRPEMRPVEETIKVSDTKSVKYSFKFK